MVIINTTDNRILFTLDGINQTDRTSYAYNVKDLSYSIKGNSVLFYLLDDAKTSTPVLNFNYVKDCEINGVQATTDNINELLEALFGYTQNELKDLEDKVDQEILDRIEADEILQDNIDEVNDKLDEEIQDRKDADQALQIQINDLIDDLNQEIDDRIAGDELLNNKITQEISDRETADNLLNDKIETEIERATEREDELQSEIDDIKTNIIEIESDIDILESGLVAEIDRATGVEEDLQNQIDLIETNVSDLTDGLAQEIIDRTNGDALLQTAIDNEITRAINRENNLQTQITQEIADRTAADTLLNTNINAEITRATNAENALQDAIDAEETRAQVAENTLTIQKQNKLVAGTNITLTPLNDSDYLTRIDVAFPGLFKIVDTLPLIGKENVIYLVPSVNPGSYDEYIWIQDEARYEMIGNTSIDLTNYYTKSETNSLLDNYQEELIAGQNITITGNTISANVDTSDFYTKDEVDDLLEDIQDEIDNKFEKINPNELYVDKNYTGTDSDGSIYRPYLTIQKAIDEALNETTIFVGVGDYSSEGVLTISDKELRIQPLTVVATNAYTFPLTVVGFDITATGYKGIALSNIYATGNININGGTAYVYIINSYIETITNGTGNTLTLNSVENANLTANGLTHNIIDCPLISITHNVGAIAVYGRTSCRSLISTANTGGYNQIFIQDQFFSPTTVLNKTGNCTIAFGSYTPEYLLNGKKLYEINGYTTGRKPNVWSDYNPTNYTVTDKYMESNFAGLDTAIATKVNTTDLTTNYYNKTQVDDLIDDVIAGDLANYYNKTQVDTLLTSKANSSDVYTKTQTDTLLGNKQNTLTAGTNITIVGDTINATSTPVDISGKLDKTTDIQTIAFVSVLPGTPDANTLYFIPV